MQRPTSVTVFGYVNIVFAVMGILSMAIVTFVLSPGPSEFDPYAGSDLMEVWGVVSQWLGTLAAVALLASGFGLLGLRSWGRQLSVWYAIYTVFVTLVGTAISFSQFQLNTSEMGGTGMNEDVIMVLAIGGGLFGIVLTLTHPILLWYFMTRPHVIAAFGGETAVGAVEVLAEPSRPDPSGNPYASPASLDAEDSLPPGVRQEQVLESIVPVGNRPALLSYYTGLFSLFPIFGLPLAIVAVVSGRRGLRNYRQNPAVHGKAHAWVGLVCGWLFGLMNAGAITLIVISFFAR